MNLLLSLIIAAASVQPGSGDGPLDWTSLEAPFLTAHTQLTFPGDFAKAGEAYFNADATWIIFQAIPRVGAGEEQDRFYSMYVAELKRDADGAFSGIDTPILISEPGSANTCGWFHPTDPGMVLFGSTITPPNMDSKSGFQVGTRKYVWQFPSETEVVQRFVPQMIGSSATDTDRPTRSTALFERPEYDAECSWSKDGRFVLYANVREERTAGREDADIWIYDSWENEHHPIVRAKGYDGGPFFSPDEKFICYRSDRKLDDRLQLYIAELAYNENGVPVGIRQQLAITDNEHVNWAPFWHPSGEYIVYGTSEVGHWNYEVFAIEVGALRRGERTVSELRTTRITHADGADVLPVFSNDGHTMMWTSQRGSKIDGEQRPSSQVWIANVAVMEGVVGEGAKGPGDEGAKGSGRILDR